MKKDMRMQVLDELNTLENMLAVWIIMKGSEFWVCQVNCV